MDRALVKLSARIACALIEMESMKAANHHRLVMGCADAYDEDSFYNLIVSHGLNEAAVAESLGEGKTP